MMRYPVSHATSLVQSYQQERLERLDHLFVHGTVPTFAQIKGETVGSFLAPSAHNPWYVSLARWWLFDAPWARWRGKRFAESWEHGSHGSGLNLFGGGRERYRFTTSHEPAHGGFDGACLVLDYRPYRGMMYGLVDDVRLIQPGVCLGRMYWVPRGWAFVGYFMLAALVESGTSPEALTT
jgi:hypothetical protein